MLKTLLLTIFIFLEIAQAKEFKAIFDCSSKDAKYINTRMMLIEKTMNMIEEDNNKVNFALTIHSGCVSMVAKNYDDIIALEDITHIQKAQETIRRISKKGVKIIACDMALRAYRIDKKDVLPFIEISENSFIDVIKYQNQGYALMPLK